MNTQTTLQHDPQCLFCKIINGTIASKKVFEDAEFLAFHDINPWAPIHFLIIPKIHISSMAALGAEHTMMMGRMMVLAPTLALQQGSKPYPQGGFRVVCNTGQDGGQEVHHLHMHVLAGPRPWSRG